MIMKIDPASFTIQLRPLLDEDDCWMGGLEVSIGYNESNPMDRESFKHLERLAEIVACSVAFMEENPEFLAKIEEFVDSSPDDAYSNEKEHSVENIGDNVVKLTFNSSTKGKA